MSVEVRLGRPQPRAAYSGFIPNRKIDLPRDLGCYLEIILEKQTVDVFKNPNTDSLLKLLGDCEIILYGVVTEIYVDCAARGLIKRGYPVHLVEDAIRHLDSHRAHATIHHVRRAWRSPAHHQRCARRVLQSAA